MDSVNILVFLVLSAIFGLSRTMNSDSFPNYQPQLSLSYKSNGEDTTAASDKLSVEPLFQRKLLNSSNIQASLTVADGKSETENGARNNISSVIHTNNDKIDSQNVKIITSHDSQLFNTTDGKTVLRVMINIKGKTAQNITGNINDTNTYNEKNKQGEGDVSELRSFGKFTVPSKMKKKKGKLFRGNGGDRFKLSNSVRLRHSKKSYASPKKHANDKRVYEKINEDDFDYTKYEDEERGYYQDERGYNQDEKWYNPEEIGYNNEERGYNQEKRGYYQEGGYNQKEREYNYPDFEDIDFGFIVLKPRSCDKGVPLIVPQKKHHRSHSHQGKYSSYSKTQHMESSERVNNILELAFDNIQFL